jgi:hypothetical protein
MRLQDEIRDQFEMRQICVANPGGNEVIKIEKVLRRAHEIHREHGGIFGYDFEEWLQAWGESPVRRSGVAVELPK